MSFDKGKFFSRRKQPVTIEVADIGSLYVYPASAGDIVDGLDKLNGSGVSHLEFSLKMVIACLCDENGKPVFEPGDLAELRKKPRDEIQPLIEAVLKVNGMTAEVDKGKEDSATDQSPTSPTA